MSGTIQVEIKSLKVGRYMVMNGKACRITKIDVSRPGKHGHAKFRVEGVGLVDGSKHVEVMPGHEKVESPLIDKKGAQVLSVNDNTANVMDSETYETFDLIIPEELKGKVKSGDNVVYWIILDDKIMMEVKNG